MPRAARLHRLVSILAESPKRREEILSGLQIGLRTFYRELDLLKRYGVRIRLAKKQYVLQGSGEDAQGRLPFPDPQLSFAEMAELTRGSGPAAQRLAELFEAVLSQSRNPPGAKRGRKGRHRRPKK
jgi:hypothetical protein